MSTKKEYADKDISTNLLITLKHMKSEFNTFTQEASNEDLYQEISQLYECTSQLQRNVFMMMSKQGWYKMTSDSSKNITKAATKYKTSESELA